MTVRLKIEQLWDVEGNCNIRTEDILFSYDDFWASLSCSENEEGMAVIDGPWVVGQLTLRVEK